MIELRELRPETLLKFGEGFAIPSPTEIRLVAQYTQKTGGELAKILGVDSRTIRRWIGGEREIPYATWRLLLYIGGLIDHSEIV